MSKKVISSQHIAKQGSVQSYTIGFLLSLLLTAIPFYVVSERLITGLGLAAFLLFIAFVQLIVQLKFFIHLTHESGTRWNMLIFLFMALVLLIVVLGSLWIMENLDYHTSGEEAAEYIIEEESIKH